MTTHSYSQSDSAPSTQNHSEMVAAWNATEVDFPRDLCLHQLFEANAAHRPDGVAAICGEETLSYGELEARANQLAHHLRRLGVAPEVRVGICAEPSLAMVI